MAAWFRNMSLAMRFALMSMLGMAALTAAVLAITWFLMMRDAAVQIENRQDSNIAVAWDALHRYGTDFQLEGGQQLTVGGHALNQDYDLVDHITEMVGGIVTIFAGDMRVATNITDADGARVIGTPLAQGPVYEAVFERKESFRGEADVLGEAYFVRYDPILNTSGDVAGVLAVAVQKAEYMAGVERLWLTLAIVCAAFALILALLIGWIAGKIFKPLVDMTEIMGQLANGDLSVDVPDGGEDEIGRIAQAVQVFKDAGLEKAKLERETEAQRAEAEAERARNEALREAAAREQARVVENLADALSALSDGDLTKSLPQAFPEDYERIRQDYNGAVGKLNVAVNAVLHNVESMKNGASEIARAAMDLSRRTEQQAASLEETAAAMEEITQTVRKTSENAASAAEQVSSTRQETNASGAVVKRAVDAMTAIESSSQQISRIIGVIDEIAFQTNLLALNAGVEAARAGESGRGFAVVAQEVRALAQRSAEAAKEIKDLINTSEEHVESGVKLVSDAGEALTRIADRVGEIDELVRAIASSSREQAVGLGEVNTAITHMDRVTQENAAMVEETTAASQQLSREGESLARSVAAFRTSDSGNLGAPRRAA